VPVNNLLSLKQHNKSESSGYPSGLPEVPRFAEGLFSMTGKKTTDRRRLSRFCRRAHLDFLLRRQTRLEYSAGKVAL